MNRLWIGEAKRTDSGNYSCTIPEHSPEEFPRARVRVHVMDGNISQINFIFSGILISSINFYITYISFAFINFFFSGDFHAAVYGKATNFSKMTPVFNAIIFILLTLCY